MPVNYAAKYVDVVDERFRLGSLTAALVNNNFDWLGVKTVKIFSRNLATLNERKQKALIDMEITINNIDNYKEIYIKVSMDTLYKRDKKGLYSSLLL